MINQKLTWHLKKWNDQALERETLTECVSYWILLFAQYFCDDKQVIEQKHFSLVHSRSLLFVHIGDFIKSTVADKAAMWKSHVLQ